MHGELWAYGEKLVITPEEGEFGLVIGYDPSMQPIPGINKSEPYVAKKLFLQAVNNNRPGFGWKEYGWEKLLFSIPNKFARPILMFLFDYDKFMAEVNKND